MFLFRTFSNLMIEIALSKYNFRLCNKSNKYIKPMLLYKKPYCTALQCIIEGQLWFRYVTTSNYYLLSVKERTLLCKIGSEIWFNVAIRCHLLTVMKGSVFQLKSKLHILNSILCSEAVFVLLLIFGRWMMWNYTSIIMLINV